MVVRVYMRKLTTTTARADKPNMTKSAKLCSGGVGMSRTLGEGPGPGPRGWSIKAAISSEDNGDQQRSARNG